MCSCLEAFAKAFLFITNFIICVSASSTLLVFVGKESIRPGITACLLLAQRPDNRVAEDFLDFDFISFLGGTLPIELSLLKVFHKLQP